MAAYSSRRLSASVESSSYGYDRSPKIVEVDTGRPKSRSSFSRRASSPLLDAGGSSGGEDWCAANPASSTLDGERWTTRRNSQTGDGRGEGTSFRTTRVRVVLCGRGRFFSNF